jgi:hypothetical protein
MSRVPYDKYCINITDAVQYLAGNVWQQQQQHLLICLVICGGRAFSVQPYSGALLLHFVWWTFSPDAPLPTSDFLVLTFHVLLPLWP